MFLGWGAVNVVVCSRKCTGIDTKDRRAHTVTEKYDRMPVCIRSVASWSFRFSERLPFPVPAFAPWFAPPAPRAGAVLLLGETEGDCRLGAAGPAARPARPPRGQMGPRSGATVQGSAFGLRVRRARIPYAYRAIGYPLTSAFTRVSVSRSRLSRRIVISPVVTEMKDETR